MTRPALEAVRAAMRRGTWPSPTEYAALLREGGFEPAAARGLFKRYSAAIAEPAVPSGEADLIASLRAFGLATD